MPVVGTAGHVDHGKSTLIEHITGRDPDRWAEEKARGLTIDLGFAWTTLPDGTEVSFVDVPGHERFLKNMLAGVEAIDVALFVVAADEGWMPQSEEHLAVLDLLDVRHGVVALTKVDAVDEDILGLARAETEERIAGTSLAEAPLVSVSAITGEGIPELLEAMADQLPPRRPPAGRPRLWVDRSFPVSGAGTVVTGTLIDGSLGIDQDIVILPEGLHGRVRGIQSHEQATEHVEPGRRVALNLGGVAHDQVVRGDMVGLPGQWLLSERFSASIRTPRFIEDFDSRGDYQLHIGSGAHRVSITGLDGPIAVLATDEPIPVKVGDRFILRDTGRQRVVAGGRVLDPSPPRNRRALATGPEIDPDADNDSIATALLEVRGVSSLGKLAAQTGGGRPRAELVVGDTALSFDETLRLTKKITRMVDDEHQARPLRPGLPLATLAERLGVEVLTAEALVEKEGSLRRIGPDVANTGHTPTTTSEQERHWARAHQMLSRGLNVPGDADLGLDPELLAYKLRSGDLVRVAPGLVYLPAQLLEIEQLLRSLEDGFTVADFRDAAGLSRKYAVPLLEWADKEGLTVRRGDIRHFR